MVFLFSTLQTEMTQDRNPIDNFLCNGIFAPHNFVQMIVQSYFKSQIKVFIRLRRIHKYRWTQLDMRQPTVRIFIRLYFCTNAG